MTNSDATPAIVAGWYADYENPTRLRWWDGTQWTEHVSDPAAAPQQYVTAPARNTVPATTPVYNAFIWLITLLPLLSIAFLFTIDFRSLALQSVSLQSLSGGTTSSLSMYSNPAFVASQLASFAIYGVTVLFAYFDWRKLGRDGFERPFPWAWIFLGSIVYVIGRSVVAHRRSGRGYLVLWVYIGVTVVGFIASIIVVSQMMSVIFANLPTIPTT
jgi:hypothetical protein